MRKASIFVIGHSATGKTPIAQAIAARLGMKLVSAGRWARDGFVPSVAASQSREVFTSELTASACAALAVQPDAAINGARAQADLDGGGIVFDGVRNPRDFSLLFDPRCDLVVHVEHLSPHAKPTPFEVEGVAAIATVARWMIDHVQAGRPSILRIVVDCYRKSDVKDVVSDETCRPVVDLDAAISEAVEWVRDRRTSVSRPSSVHATVATVNAWLDPAALYDGARPSNDWRAAQIIGVSSYAGCALTLTMYVVAEGGTFFNVPLHYVRETVTAFPCNLTSDDISWRNCPEGRIATVRYGRLQGAKLEAIFPRAKQRVSVRYLFSVEWYDANELAHVVSMMSGAIALVPNHRLLAAGAPVPDWRKMRSEWKVNEET